MNSYEWKQERNILCFILDLSSSICSVHNECKNLWWIFFYVLPFFFSVPYYYITKIFPFLQKMSFLQYHLIKVYIYWQTSTIHTGKDTSWKQWQTMHASFCFTYWFLTLNLWMGNIFKVYLYVVCLLSIEFQSKFLAEILKSLDPFTAKEKLFFLLLDSEQIVSYRVALFASVAEKIQTRVVPEGWSILFSIVHFDKAVFMCLMLFRSTIHH